MSAVISKGDIRPTAGLSGGCVKTSFKSVFGASVADFRKSQSAKPLILLTHNFGE